MKNPVRGRHIKSVLAGVLSAVLAVDSLQAIPFGADRVPAFSLSLPAKLGFVSDSYSPRPGGNAVPDVVLIQNLHVNRSVQFAISKILKRIQERGWMPDHIAVE